MDALDDLANQWRIAKEKEDSARNLRVFLESEILKLHPAKEEGSETFSTPAGAKIKLTGKISYKADLAKLQALTANWQQDAIPIKTEVKIDETKLKMIRSDAPRMWAEIASAVTVTPAKTGVAIEFKE